MCGGSLPVCSDLSVWCWSMSVWRWSMPECVVLVYECGGGLRVCGNL